MSACSSEKGSKKIYGSLLKYKDALLDTTSALNDISSLVCFLQIVSCNGDCPCSFSDAWCFTVRSIDVDPKGRYPIVYYADLFDVSALTQFLETGVLPDDKKGHRALLTALDRLAQFLDNYEETCRILEKFAEKDLREVEWAGIFGIHIVKKLAVVQDMRLSDAGDDKMSVCICGCGEDLEYGDTSFGNKTVWHGNSDILLGGVAIDITSPVSEERRTSKFEMESYSLDKYRHQFVAETIAFSCSHNKGLVPTVAVSRENMKVFLYDLDSDLLFESAEFPLISFTQEKELPYLTIIAIWLAVNYQLFGLSISPVYKEAGYFANFRTFISEKKKMEIYENQMHLFGCKKVHTVLPALADILQKKGKKKFWRVPRS